MIPKFIWQTYKTPFPAKQSAQSIKSWLDLNPDYEWYYFDDAKCEQFIRDHFSDEFYQMYVSLPIGVMKSDVWRVAVVYVYGGVYADTDTKCLVPIDQWIGEYDLVAGVETPYGAINNFIFAAKAKHPAVYAVIETFLEFYKSPYYLDKNSPTPVQDFGANAWSYGLLRYYGTENPELMEKGADYYNTIEKVQQEKTKFFSYHSNAFSPVPNKDTLVYHQTGSVAWHNGYESWRREQSEKLKV